VAVLEFIPAGDFRTCLERDAEELLACLRSGAWKAAQVMAASLIQAVLAEYLVSAGKISEQDIERLSLTELLEYCRDRQILSQRTVDLAAFLRPPAEYLSPLRSVRPHALADETSARIAQALLEIVINEVSQHQRQNYRYTAEQLLGKLRSDPAADSILPHLLNRTGRQELDRLVLDLLPRTYLDIARSDEPGREETLGRLELCYRLALDSAPDELKRQAARRFVEVLENESEFVVQCYQTAFFRGADLAYLEPEQRRLVKAHFLASLEKRPSANLIRAAGGMGSFLENEQEVRGFFLPLLLGLIQTSDKDTAAAAEKGLLQEYGRLGIAFQRNVRGWISRLRWSLKAVEDPAAAQLEALESMLDRTQAAA